MAYWIFLPHKLFVEGATVQSNPLWHQIICSIYTLKAILNLLLDEASILAANIN